MFDVLNIQFESNYFWNQFIKSRCVHCDISVAGSRWYVRFWVSSSWITWKEVKKLNRYRYSMLASEMIENFKQFLKDHCWGGSWKEIFLLFTSRSWRCSCYYLHISVHISVHCFPTPSLSDIHSFKYDFNSTHLDSCHFRSVQIIENMQIEKKTAMQRFDNFFFKCLKRGQNMFDLSCW